MKGRTILATREFLNECNVVIHLNKTYVQYPKRVNDVSIMHLVNTQTTHKVTMNQKEKINCVRMYLGVQYVGEISTISGARCVSGILDGDNYQLNYRTTLTKPHQEKLGNHSWSLWKKILKTLTTTPKTTTNSLQQELGPWIKTHSECGKWLSYQERNGSVYA